MGAAQPVKPLASKLSPVAEGISEDHPQAPLLHPASNSTSNCTSTSTSAERVSGRALKELKAEEGDADWRKFVESKAKLSMLSAGQYTAATGATPPLLPPRPSTRAPSHTGGRQPLMPAIERAAAGAPGGRRLGPSPRGGSPGPSSRGAGAGSSPSRGGGKRDKSPPAGMQSAGVQSAAASVPAVRGGQGHVRAKSKDAAAGKEDRDREMEDDGE